MFRQVRDVPQPMIAAVHGFALGGGTELAMLADFIVASDDAVFGLTEVSLGIIPGGGGTQSLPRLIGRNRAKELIFSARRISASEALALGLVNHVVPRTELLPKATALAEEILKNSPFAVRQVKWAIDRGADLPFEDGVEREHEAYMRAIASEDRRELGGVDVPPADHAHDLPLTGRALQRGGDPGGPGTFGDDVGALGEQPHRRRDLLHARDE